MVGKWMKFKAQGTIQVFVTAEFEDDGTSIGDQAHRALLSKVACRRWLESYEVINFEFDRVEGGGEG